MSQSWLSLWSSAANSWASAVRGFWTAELRRPADGDANEMIRQTMNFWATTLHGADHRPKPKRRR